MPESVAYIKENRLRVKDPLQNDTGYFRDSVRAYLFSSDELLGEGR